MTEQLDAGMVAAQIAESDQRNEPDASPQIGRGRKCKEDPKLLTGQTTWTDNITFPGMLHMALLRSPMAHAPITWVDVSAAKEQPDMVAPEHHPLAVDEVRYVGDAVAVVVARDRYCAIDALEAIDVEYEPLPAVVDMEEALADVVLVHADKGTNGCFFWPFEGGDYEATKARADVVLRRRYIQQRLIPTAIEPRGVVVAPIAAAEEFTVYSSTQIPHILRLMLAMTTGIPEHKIRVVAPDVGGGFGSKLDVYAEEVLGLIVAKHLGRPIKWTESRSDNYQATIHGRDQIQDIEIAATRTERCLACRWTSRPTWAPICSSSRRASRSSVPSCSTASTSSRAISSSPPGCSPPRPHRRLPRRGPAGSDVWRRTDHDRSRRRARDGSDGAAAEELDHPRGVPVHDHLRADL